MSVMQIVRNFAGHLQFFPKFCGKFVFFPKNWVPKFAISFAEMPFRPGNPWKLVIWFFQATFTKILEKNCKFLAKILKNCKFLEKNGNSQGN